MIILGLTGGIGMGKSTTARMFADRGVPVWDADAAVHRLYRQGGAAVAKIGSLFPNAIDDGAVNRQQLKAEISSDSKALRKIETIVHPLVTADREQFLQIETAPVVLLDIPLLFEFGTDALCTYTIVVSAPADVQKARVLARPGMTEQQLQIILEKQKPDAEKRKRADFVIETIDLDSAKRSVDDILEQVTGQNYA